MENSFQTSFIPKRPINTTVNRASRPPSSFLTIFSFIILIVVGGAALGLFLYKNYLIKQKEVLSASLARVRDSFEKDTIAELELYDKRVSASKQILGSHIVFSPMFSLIGSLTIPSIQYTKFNQETTASGFSVTMSGIAQDYKSIALQADVFNTAKGRSFKNVVFSNLTKDKSGTVSFDIAFTVDPSLLSYEKNRAQEALESRTEAKTNPITEPTLLPQEPASSKSSNTTSPSSTGEGEKGKPDNNLSDQ